MVPLAESGSFITRESVLKASGCVAVVGDETGSANASFIDTSAPPLDSLSFREGENHDVSQPILKGDGGYLEWWCVGRNRGCAAGLRC